jgi:hypothetical protein
LPQRNSAEISRLSVLRHENAALGNRLRPNRVEPLPPSRVICAVVKAVFFRSAMGITSAGFAPPANRKLGAEHRTVAIAEFIASLSLAVSILVVVTVSVARADVLSGVIDNEGGVFAIALLLGLLFIGMGGVTIVSLPHPSRHRKTHS